MPTSKKVKPTGRRERLELARKQAKRNRTIGIIVVTVVIAVALAAIALVVYNTIQNNNAETFGIGEVALRLRSDGRFTADLDHDVKYRGRYTLAEQGGATVVTFTHNGMTVDGEIIDDEFHIPHEWQDSCGHTSILPKR